MLEEESQEEDKKLEGVCDGYNERELQEVLGEFEEVFSDKPGNTKVVEVDIDTGDAQPFWLAPYSVPLGIRGQVKAELDSLLEAGMRGVIVSGHLP